MCLLVCDGPIHTIINDLLFLLLRFPLVRGQFGVTWAYVMLVVYPIGIPLVYTYLLFLARNDIKGQKVKHLLHTPSYFVVLSVLK